MDDAAGRATPGDRDRPARRWVVYTSRFYAVSPWVLGFARSHHDLAVHDLIVGNAICLLAGGFTVAPERMTALSVALGVTGLWMAVSPWVGGYAPGRATAIGGVVLGVLTLMLGLVSTAMVRRANRVPRLSVPRL